MILQKKQIRILTKRKSHYIIENGKSKTYNVYCCKECYLRLVNWPQLDLEAHPDSNVDIARSTTWHSLEKVSQ